MDVYTLVILKGIYLQLVMFVRFVSVPSSQDRAVVMDGP